MPAARLKSLGDQGCGDWGHPNAIMVTSGGKRPWKQTKEGLPSPEVASAMVSSAPPFPGPLPSSEGMQTLRSQNSATSKTVSRAKGPRPASRGWGAPSIVGQD